MANDFDQLFDKDIFEFLGIKNIDPRKREEITETMMDTIENRVIARIFDNIPEAEQESFQQLFESEDKQKITKYLEEKNIDIQKFYIEEALNYKIDIIQLMNAKGELKDD
jgi:hypothetical protein